MASVQELKNALETEQTKALEVADRALTSIDTLLSLSMWAVSICAFIVAFVAIFGWAVIAGASRRQTKKIAEHAIEAYINGEEFTNVLEKSVRREVKERFRETVILTNITEESAGGAPNPFPKPPGSKQ